MDHTPQHNETRKPILGVSFDTVPWVPVSGQSCFKPVRFASDGNGWANYIRVMAGGAIPRSRVTGGAHAYTLRGTWLDRVTDCRSGPGSYTYEPPGTPHEAIVEGNEELIVLMVVHGRVEYIDQTDTVIRIDTAVDKEAAYRRFCLGHGITPLDLRA